MAALLVGLRLRLLWHSLTRSPWHIVGLVIGGLGALSMLGLAVVGLLAMRVLAPALAPSLLVVAGSVLVIGWIVGSVVVAGMDETLAPERFALLPVRARALQPGLAIAGLLGVPGIATTLALLASLIGWSIDGWALLAAVLMLPFALLSCFLLARLATLVLGQVLADRRTRDLMTVVAVLAIIGLSFAYQFVVIGLVEGGGDWSTQLDAIAAVLAWTPFGAPWGVPAAVADGAWLVAAGRALIAVATVGLAWIAWGVLLERRLTAPVQARQGGTVRSGGRLERLLPATAVGAIAGRSLRMRRRDPRHLMNLLSFVVVPAALIAMQLVVSRSVEGEGFSLAIMPPLLCVLVLAQVVHLDAAYDGSALALHALTGVSGAADRAGRLLGIALWAVPLLVLVSVVSVAVDGDWSLLPVALAVTLGIGGVVAGVASWLGALWPGHTPPAGANPFGKGSSGGTEAMLGMLAITGVSTIVSLPTIAAAIASSWLPWMAWVALVVGLVLASLSIALGIRFGGRALERRWPEVLRSVSLDQSR